MKLDKAIQLCRDAENSLRLHKQIDHADAIKLATEALKEFSALRNVLKGLGKSLLPSETPQ